MRIPSTISLGLVVVSTIVSAMFWRELHTERQRTTDLQTQLDEANSALAASRAAPPAPAAPVEVAVTTPAATVTPAPAAEKAALAEASARVVSEGAKRQKAMLEDTEYRNARIEQTRGNLKLRYATLAKDLGISDQQADALLTVLAEGVLRQEKGMAEHMSSMTAAPDPATIAELTRVQQELQQRQKNAVAALLGPAKAAEFQEYEETAPSRQRITNLTTMLAQGGKPLTETQSKQLSKLMVAEQRRRESDMKAGLVDMRTQGEAAIESDSRVLAGAMSFLDSQQAALMKARFEQVAARQRATDRVQQRAVESVQGANGGQ